MINEIFIKRVRKKQIEFIEDMKKEYDLNFFKFNHDFMSFISHDKNLLIHFDLKEVEYISDAGENIPIPFDMLFKITSFLINMTSSENEIVKKFMLDIKK